MNKIKSMKDLLLIISLMVFISFLIGCQKKSKISESSPPPNPYKNGRVSLVNLSEISLRFSYTQIHGSDRKSYTYNGYVIYKETMSLKDLFTNSEYITGGDSLYIISETSQWWEKTDKFIVDGSVKVYFYLDGYYSIVHE
jgi:hypothetical protein